MLGPKIVVMNSEDFDTKKRDYYKSVIYLFEELLTHGYFSSIIFLQLAVLEWEEIASVGDEAFAWYFVALRQLVLLVSITNIYINQDPFSYCWIQRKTEGEDGDTAKAPSKRPNKFRNIDISKSWRNLHSSRALDLFTSFIYDTFQTKKKA